MKISLRKLHDIDLDSFRTDILNSSLFFPSPIIERLVNEFNNVLMDLRDNDAPLITRTARCRPKCTMVH